MPPAALTSLTHSSYPCLKAWPSVEKSPVREREAPMEIGAEDDGEVLAEQLGLVDPAELLLLLLLLPPLLHAARTPTESATAPSATAFLENQGRCALTPGSSFLIGHGCWVRSAGCLREPTLGGYTGKL